MQYLRDILYSITVANVVDVAFIAFLIYLFVSSLRTTRAFQILVSLLGISLLFYLATAMGLILTSVFFQYIWTAIVIVLVIVFQPEIREMLERATPIRYLRGSRPGTLEPDLIEATVEAVTRLAKTKTGALIVFQRADRIANLILEGKALDGVVSEEALVMIFQKTSPLHDGAVIIKNGRIASAGCILPVSKNEDLSSHYGTRHRAAVGICERSDALCVVVSEERGEISIVEGKQIANYQNTDAMRETLRRGLLPNDTPPEPNLPRPLARIGKNWKLKLASIGTAAFLWVIVVGPQRSEVGISVPIQYTNLPPEMEITGKWMDRIDVRLRGSEGSLANLRPGVVRALVDLSGVVTGLNYFRINEKNLQVPPGIAISKIRPSDLHLKIEAASVKKFPVNINTDSIIPANMRVSMNPKEVQVRGLSKDLDKIKRVVTEPFDVDELLTGRQMNLALEVEPSDVRIDGIEPLTVSITLEDPMKTNGGPKSPTGDGNNGSPSTR